MGCGDILQRVQNYSCKGEISSRDVLYNMMTVTKNIALYSEQNSLKTNKWFYIMTLIHNHVAFYYIYYKEV
jgi:hypothetical protein